MATTGIGFRWLDILEKEFDKACVELDTSLAQLETEEPEVVFAARQKIATLGSCFSQLTHKALTIFQNSAKLEAELVDMRAELVQARIASSGCQESGDGVGNVSDAVRARSEAAQLARENVALRETVLALHSELFGARLATKYLDKELAGRIQQLQLLGRDMRAEVRDSLWAQVEAEILLQRHKTLVRVCRGVSPWPVRPAAVGSGGGGRGAGVRTVRVRRSPHLGLGISVTGGREHGVPVLISELEAGGPAALTNQLYVGDAILAINDVDLTQACHKEAVQALQSVKGDCALCVQFIATDDDDRLSEDNYRFPLFPEECVEVEREQDGSGATPTAPRTPEYNYRGGDSDAESVSECAPRRVDTAAAQYNSTEYNSINNSDYNSISKDFSNINKTDYTIINKLDCNNISNDKSDYNNDKPDYNVDKSDYNVDKSDYNNIDKSDYNVDKSYYNIDKSDYNVDKPDYNNLAKSEFNNSNKSEYNNVDKPVYNNVSHSDYNNINNNLNILDMDDDSIKIETRVEWSGAGSQRYSSGESAHSTPVHTRHHNFKKKRKPQDWRTKGAYRAVALDAASADEHTQHTDCGESAAPVEVPPPPEHKLNGEHKPRREGNKGFRIGSARRVTESAPAQSHTSNTSHTQTQHTSHTQTQHTSHTQNTPHAKHTQLLSHSAVSSLRTGDGDPDFGTPV